MKKILIILFLLIACTVTFGQTTTTTATVTFPDGQTFQNGTVQAIFTPPTGVIDQNLYTINGAAFPYTVNGTFNGAGQFNLTLTDDHLVRPLGGRWNFVVCSVASAPCTQSLQDVFGASIDLSSQISANVKNISQQPSNLPIAFVDTEVQNGPNGGSSYFSYVSKTFRCFNGSAWADCGGGGGGSVPTDVIGKYLASQGTGVTSVFQTTPYIDVRDGFGGSGGVDCTGATDSTAKLQAMINNAPDFSEFDFPTGCKVLVTTSVGSPVAITIQGRYGLVFKFNGRNANACDVGGVGNGGARIIDNSTYASGAKIFYINQSQRLQFINPTISTNTGAVDEFFDVDQTTSPPINTQNEFHNVCLGNNTSTRNASFAGMRFSNTSLSNLEKEYITGQSSILCSTSSASSQTSNGYAVLYGNNVNQKVERVEGLSTTNCSVGVQYSVGGVMEITGLMASSDWTNVFLGGYNDSLKESRFEANTGGNQVTITNPLGTHLIEGVDFAINPVGTINCNVNAIGQTGGCGNLIVINSQADNQNDWFNTSQGGGVGAGINSQLVAFGDRNLFISSEYDFADGTFFIPGNVGGFAGAPSGVAGFNGQNSVSNYQSILNTFGMYFGAAYPSNTSQPANVASAPIILDATSGNTPQHDALTIQVMPNAFSGAAPSDTLLLDPLNSSGSVPFWLAFPGIESGFNISPMPAVYTGIKSLSARGAGGSATYCYQMVARGNTGTVIATPIACYSGGNNTLSGANYNSMYTPQVPGASSMVVYRTTCGGSGGVCIGGGPTGKIGTFPSACSLSNVNCNASGIPFIDTGLVGDNTTPPATNTTGAIDFWDNGLGVGSNLQAQIFGFDDSTNPGGLNITTFNAKSGVKIDGSSTAPSPYVDLYSSSGANNGASFFVSASSQTISNGCTHNISANGGWYLNSAGPSVASLYNMCGDYTGTYSTPLTVAPSTYSNLNTNFPCASYEGTFGSVTDSTVNTSGSVIAGGGTLHVGAYCDGSNWRVVNGSASAATNGYNGVNIQTGNYTAGSGDSGKVVVMNCGSSCTFTLYATPTATYKVSMLSIGAVTPTISLNSLQYNGAASVPVPTAFEMLDFNSNGTNYYGQPPLTNGNNTVVVGASNSIVVNSASQTGTWFQTSTGSSGQPAVSVSGDIYSTAFVPTSTYNAGHITLNVSTIDNSGNLYSFGIYAHGSPDTQMCTTGAIAGTSFANVTGLHTIAFTSACSLVAGVRYDFAMTGNATTLQIMMTASGAVVAALNHGQTTATTGGTLPSTYTPPADSYTGGIYPNVIFSN